MVRGCDTRDRRAYSRVGGDLERASGGRRGEGRRSLRRRRNGDEHSHGSEDPLGSTSWEHGRGSATRVGQLSSRGTGKGESSLSLAFLNARVSPPRLELEERAIPTIEQIFPSFHNTSSNVPPFQISLSREVREYRSKSTDRRDRLRRVCASCNRNNVIVNRAQFVSTS